MYKSINHLEINRKESTFAEQNSIFC